MVKVKNEIKVYEDGLVSVDDKEHIFVDSHWNNDSFVVLKVGNVSVTVVANDLRAAIDNATNVARY